MAPRLPIASAIPRLRSAQRFASCGLSAQVRHARQAGGRRSRHVRLPACTAKLAAPPAADRNPASRSSEYKRIRPASSARRGRDPTAAHAARIAPARHGLLDVPARLVEAAVEQVVQATPREMLIAGDLGPHPTRDRHRLLDQGQRFGEALAVAGQDHAVIREERRHRFFRPGLVGNGTTALDRAPRVRVVGRPVKNRDADEAQSRLDEPSAQLLVAIGVVPQRRLGEIPRLAIDPGAAVRRHPLGVARRPQQHLHRLLAIVAAREVVRQQRRPLGAGSPLPASSISPMRSCSWRRCRSSSPSYATSWVRLSPKRYSSFGEEALAVNDAAALQLVQLARRRRCPRRRAAARAAHG